MLEVPRVLYKYRSLSRKRDRDHTRQLIVEHQIHFACVDDFNDPFDCQAELIVRRGKPEDWRRLGFPRRPPREIRDKWKAEIGPGLITKMARKLGIFCSTSDPRSIPMWSYYTNGHKGLCFGFRTTRASGSPLWDSRQVEYSDEYPAYDPLLDVDERHGRQAESLLLRKSTAWQHEREWRAFNTGGPGVVEYGAHVLTEIILGCRIVAKHRDEILRWVEMSGQTVKVLQARRHDRQYRLELDVIHEA